MIKFEKSQGWVKLRLNTKIYSPQTIYSSGYVFLDRAYVYLEPAGKDVIAVWLRPKIARVSLDQLALDFGQELINYAHYFASLKANAENLKLLLQRALFSAAPSLVKEAEEQEIQDLIKELEAEENLSKSNGKKQARRK